jgi:PKD repeat protein
MNARRTYRATIREVGARGLATSQRRPLIVSLALGASVLLGAFAAVASAEPATLAITSPNPKAVSWLNTQTPAIEGETAKPIFNLDLEGEKFVPVEVKIYEGSRVEGAPVQTVSTQPFTGPEWSVQPSSPLPDHTYTAQAVQGAETSNEVTFTTDVSAPAPEIMAPHSGSAASGEVQTIEGSAGTEQGDLPEVTVRLFAGSAVTAQPLEEIPVRSSSGRWAVAVALQPGTYTALAVQRDAAGNIGESKPASFAVLSSTSSGALPAASFTWLPSIPVAGQGVALVSNSTDASSWITSYAWDVAGNGPFAAGGPVLTTTFSTPGSHTVRLLVSDAMGAQNVASASIPVSAAALTLMQPFPIVRIGGSETARGVRVSSLSVLAPVGVRVTVTCTGPSCKLKPQSAQASANSHNRRGGSVLLTFPRFQRFLPAGVTLEVRVLAPGEIGKYTRFRIRRHSVPSRLDACLSGLDPKPIACPA